MEKGKTLNMQGVFGEWLFLLPRLILPLIIFVVSIILMIRQDDYSVEVFLINFLIAFLVVIYLLIFLIQRMISKFKEGKIAENQVNIVKSQSKQQLGISLMIFLAIILALFSLAIFYGVEQGPFRTFLFILDILLVVAAIYSYMQRK